MTQSYILNNHFLAILLEKVKDDYDYYYGQNDNTNDFLSKLRS